MRIEEMEPLITVGAAFALSVVGYLMSNRQPKPKRHSIQSTPSESDLSSMAEPSTSSSRCPVTGSSNPAATPGTCPRGFKRGLRIIENDDARVNVIQRGTVAPPPLLLPPLHEEPKQEEQENTTSNESKDPSQNETDQEPKTETIDQQNITLSEKEEEIERLRLLAQSLLDKERNIELQMLEYYGLKEQEEAMREMERELKVNSAETKYLAHKVESLEEENERLKRQILEMEKMKEKLDSNKGKITMLKKRLRLEDENAQEKIVLLRQRIEVLAEKNNKSSTDYEEIESKLARVKELEEEVNELRKINSKLEEENCGLTQRLESAQLSASTREPEQVLEEATQLRETNEKLAKQIDQLLDDHSSSVEEIVYLRWLNACLRYELRNFNNPKSKNQSIARDLNKSSSHNSKEIVKQLIVEYSNQGIDIRDPNFDFDFSNPNSPSHHLNSPAQNSERTTPKGKSKKPNIFTSIKKIVTGSKHSSNTSTTTNKGKTLLLSPDSNASYNSCSNNSSPLSDITTIEPASNFTRSANHPRASLNIPKSSKVESQNARSRSDLGSRFIGARYQSLNLDHPSIDFEDPQNKEIDKLARALRSSSESPTH